jgi:DNA-binding NarL/FixJ family response regulator
LLEDEPDIEVVAEAGSVAEALRMVAEHSPEVVITQASVFGVAASQVEKVILQVSPRSKVLFLTMHEGGAPFPEAGVEGMSCAVRQTSARELGEMIRRAYFRETTSFRELPPIGLGEKREGEHSRKGVLTTREREVLELLAEGKTVRSAASILGVSVKTVDAHKFNLMRKLGIHNKAELVVWAIQQKVLKLPANF